MNRVEAVPPPAADRKPVAAGDQAEGLRRLFASVRRRRRGAQAQDAAQTPEHRCPIVAIASGKGGVGKTTLAVNVAITLAANHRVTLLDADPGCANADVLLGMSPRRRIDAAIAEGASFAELAVDAPGGFRLVPGAVGSPGVIEPDEHGRSALVRGLSSLEADSDLVLIDCGAGLGRLTIALLAASDLGVVVATPEPTSIADAYALVKLLVRGGYGHQHALPSRTPRHPPLGLVINSADSHSEADVVHGRIRGVAASHLGYRPEILGSVRYDPRVGDACRKRRPLAIDRPKAPAARDIAATAAAIALRCGAAARPRPERA